jgi:hypothetical protein
MRGRKRLFAKALQWTVDVFVARGEYYESSIMRSWLLIIWHDAYLIVELNRFAVGFAILTIPT